jgi:hypothetical protein
MLTDIEELSSTGELNGTDELGRIVKLTLLEVDCPLELADMDELMGIGELTTIDVLALLEPALCEVDGVREFVC